MKKKYGTLFLHYKQGDDLSYCIEKAGSNIEGLKRWKNGMIANAEHLEKIVKSLEGKDFEIDADTHHIGFRGDKEIIDCLIDAELLEKEPDFEEDCEDCDCEDCDC